VNKLPVRETIRSAYQFTFAQLGTIIGLIWAPMVVIAVLRFLPYGMGDTHLSADQNPSAVGAAALRGIVFALASVLLYASVNVAVVRQALGLRKGPALIHFAMGRAEFRMAGAMLVLSLIVVVLLVLSVFAMLASAAVGAALGDAVLSGLFGASVFLLGACIVLAAIVRLGFLVVPITVVENKISFERGWLLTKGNFWRISSVLFVVTLPVVAIEFAAVFSLVGKDIVALAALAPHLTPEVLSDRLQTIMDNHISAIIGINLIVAPFSLGLALGAAAAGYKALAGTPGANGISVAGAA
jgi:hypothetical protein